MLNNNENKLSSNSVPQTHGGESMLMKGQINEAIGAVENDSQSKLCYESSEASSIFGGKDGSAQNQSDIGELKAIRSDLIHQ